MRRTTSEAHIQATLRQNEAVKLRLTGLSLAEIAERLGYASAGGAHHAINHALKKTLQEPADTLRKLECERLDALLLGLWPAAVAGDRRAVETILNLMSRRARLLGLDMPTTVAMTNPDGSPLSGMRALSDAQLEVLLLKAQAELNKAEAAAAAAAAAAQETTTEGQENVGPAQHTEPGV